jgi:prevent-host-death family protein
VYQINIHQAKTQLSKLVEEAASGKEIIIAKSGKPIARLVSLEKMSSKPRTPGALKGKILIADQFDAPMNETELASWNTASIFPD